MKNFWQTLPKPFFALAPMDDVTDVAFRQIVASLGKPDIFFTEFISSDGLCSVGLEKLLPKLEFSSKEKPIVAQIWGANPDHMLKSAQLISKMGFDGIDINMGCPDKSVMRQKGGAALIDDPDLAREIVKAVKKGANELPVSVKTRLGVREIKTQEWIPFLLSLNLDAIIIHGRTAKEMSKMPSHWEEIARAVKMRNTLKSKTKIIGNGDIKSYQEGLEKIKKYGVDGVMIGRGIFENPWFFNPRVNLKSVTKKERLEVLQNHIKLFDKTYGDKKNFDTLKKFFKIYVNGFNGANKLRIKLMETKTIQEARGVITS